MKKIVKQVKAEVGYNWIDYSFAATLSALSGVLGYSVFKLMEIAGY